MRNNYLLIVIFFSLISLSETTLLGYQTNITTNQNVYKRVTAIGGNYVIVDNTTDLYKFEAGDTVLIIQMKGVETRIDETGFYGDPENVIGTPGKYEFALIESVNMVTRQINLKSSFVNAYNALGNVQIIKVASYESAIVQNTLTCPAWDSLSGTGGVLVLSVERSLKLNSDIDVSGKGFSGGMAVLGDGICTEVDPVNYYKFSYPLSYTNAGFKGESFATTGWLDFSTQYPIFPQFSKGRGGNGNGGGGGNGRFSGGGGGSNYGPGGRGGRESRDICSTVLTGGLGGKSMSGYLSNGVFMGGGGGGSTYLAGANPSSGAGGGGLIIVLCIDIDGNGHSIRANGASPLNNAVGYTGAGGGGGGGSVALYTEYFKTTVLTLEAAGGNGGNTTNSYGEGGGGGGGFIMTNMALPGNVTRIFTGGAKGLNTGTITAMAGSAGSYITYMTPVLNNFFFNSIWSSVSGNRSDSIITSNIPPAINGSMPVAAALPLTYLWQKKYEGSGWTNIPGSNSLNYTPVLPESSKVFFRRVITDAMGVSDTSKYVEFKTCIVTAMEPVYPAGGVGIYPNPAMSSAELFFNDINRGEVEIYIFDTSGRKISSCTSEKCSDEFRYLIELNGIKSGAYYLKVFINKKGLYTVKMLVK